jgi:hypothetical protein
MKSLKEFILDIKKIDSNILIYGGFGVILVFLGGQLINMNPPNFQVGYPTLAIGFAFFVFSTTLNNSKKTSQKMDQIMTKLNEIQEDLKKREG